MANGSTQLTLLAKRLKAAGEMGIKREMVRGLRQAAVPIVPKLREAARSELPKRGGLNETVANQDIKVSVRTTGRQAGVRVRAQTPGNYTNTGTWRHPVFGNRKKWVVETYEPAAKWWDKVTEEANLPARAEALRVLKSIADQVNGMGI